MFIEVGILNDCNSLLLKQNKNRKTAKNQFQEAQEQRTTFKFNWKRMQKQILIGMCIF